MVLVRKRGDLDKVRKAEVEARKAIDAKYKALRGDIGLLRHEPLGTDRNERSYWHLGGDLSVLFVRSPNPVAPDGWIDEGAAAAAAAKLGRTRRATQKVQLSAELTAGATWCVLHTSEEVDTVVASLRLEGRREYKLASVLADCKEAMASARASAAERAARFDPASTSMSVVAFSRATRFLQKSEQTSVVIELNETVDKLSLAERESPSALAEATGFASPPGHFDWRTQRFRAELIDIVDGASVFFYSFVCSILLFYSFVYSILSLLYSFVCSRRPSSVSYSLAMHRPSSLTSSASLPPPRVSPAHVARRLLPAFPALPDCTFADVAFDLEHREAWVDDEVRAANSPADLTQIVLDLAERVVAVTLNPRWSAQERVLAIANGAIIEQLQLDGGGAPSPGSGSGGGGVAAPADAAASALSPNAAKDAAPAAPLAEVDPELLAEATRQQEKIRKWLDAPVLAVPFCYLYALDNALCYNEKQALHLIKLGKRQSSPRGKKRKSSAATSESGSSVDASGGAKKKKARESPREREKRKKTKAALAELRGERQKKSKQKKPHDPLKVMRMAYDNGDVYEGPLDVDDEWHGFGTYTFNTGEKYTGEVRGLFAFPFPFVFPFPFAHLPISRARSLSLPPFSLSLSLSLSRSLALSLSFLPLQFNHGTASGRGSKIFPNGNKYEGQVSVLLCTVTCYANLAHSLTRSP